MKQIRIHFTTGKVHEMNVHDGDAEGIAYVLDNSSSTGTTSPTYRSSLPSGVPYGTKRCISARMGVVL